MLCAGTLLPLFLAYARYSAGQDRRWERVTGKVLVSRVEFQWEDYQPIVEYVYCHNGIEYRGKKIRSHLVVYNFKGPAERLCARYPSGASVEVYIDPNNPERSVLEPGGDAWLLGVGVPVALLFIVLGALLALD